MSSLKMTFSLTSLIFLIALGLVFAPTAVMAHDNIEGDTNFATHATTGHMHPVVTIVDPTDVDSTTAGIQVFDKAEDDDSGLTGTIQFDVMLTLPSTGLDTTALTGQIADAEISAFARTAAYVPVGTGTDGAVGVTATADTDDATMVTLALTITITDANDDTAVDDDEERVAFIKALIDAGIYVDISVNAAAIQTIDVVPSAPMHDQFNLQTSTLTVMIAGGTSKPKATVTVAANTYHDSKRFMVTITLDEALTDDTATADVDESVLTIADIDPGDKARVLPGSIKAVGTDGLGWTAIIEPLLTDEKGDIVVTVKGSNVGPADTSGSVTVMHAKPGATTRDVSSNLSGTLTADGFAVISRSGAIDGFSDSVTQVELSTMPNLQRFLLLRGSITLYTSGTDKTKDVVISEIMWGLDLNGDPSGENERDDHQWIEVYNTTGSDINLSDIEIEFSSAAAVPTADNLVDQFSNIARAGWVVNQGQNGALSTDREEGEALVDLVSMYRNINYATVRKTDHDKDAAKNRAAQIGGVPDGKVSGSWLRSNDEDVFALNRVGSPGAEHIDITKDFPPTPVGRDKVVITEVGNNSNDAYDWVELKAIVDTNLDTYELQIVKPDDDNNPVITVLAQFVNKELKAGEILLVVQSTPLFNSSHPIAAGKEWKLEAVDQLERGTKSLYHVDAKLKIPNDDKKTLFILRNAKDKKDHNNIADLAGNYFHTDNSAAYRTSLWPLQSTAAGGGNVIDGDVEDFNAGRVYVRSSGSTGIADKNWAVGGYTGVGYKRSAATTGQNGGTPGFDNGSLKDKNSVLTDAKVTISEIMYDRGSRDNLPQWIELYNSSMTEAINLDGWKLMIENAGDDVDIRRGMVTVKNLGAKIIQPNQTVLIVAYVTGNVSGGRQGRVDFPIQRVINLAGMDELEVPEGKTRDYRLLSAEGFKLTLVEKDATVDTPDVDVAGNMGATPAWDLPMDADGEGRSSIIRRYNEGKMTRGGMEAADGTQGVWTGGKNAGGMPGDAGWILASVSNFNEARAETFYGHRDDIGTPGYRARGAVPVSLSKFRPERLKDTGEIVVRWVTESELNNAGFNILRSEKRDKDFTKVHYVAGQGTTSERTVYEWKDKSAKPNVVYYYQIQDVSLDGEVTTLRTTHLRGNVTAAGKLTTTWGEIKALQ